MKGGDRVQPGLSSMSASIRTSDTNLVSDPNNDMTPSTSSRIAPKSLEKAYPTPSTGAVPKMRSAETPSLEEICHH